ncbi:MAG: ATP-binding protein [Burkholderiales bacterium]|nr:ATP-binding protein [Burkholderiales bacterium]
MIFGLPDIRSDETGFRALASLWNSAQALEFSKLELDMTRCTWFDANMCAALGAVLARIADRLNAVEIVDVRPEVENVLCRNGFLTHFGYRAVEDRQRTTLPYRRLRLTDSGRFEDYLRDQLLGKGIPEMATGFGRVFKQSLFEIFENAVHHSQSAAGVFVCGQFYPTRHCLDISIADAGVGIPANVERFLGHPLAAEQALAWALQKGHTTKRGVLPGGVGLKFLKDFVAKNGGELVIASGGAFYRYAETRDSVEPLEFTFPGTVVNLEIDTTDTKTYSLDGEVSPEGIF